MVLPTVVANHFFKLKVLNKFGQKEATIHKAKSKLLSKVKSGSSAGNTTLLSRNEEGKWAIAPILEGRIVNVAPPAEE